MQLGSKSAFTRPNARVRLCCSKLSDGQLQGTLFPVAASRDPRNLVVIWSGRERVRRYISLNKRIPRSEMLKVVAGLLCVRYEDSASGEGNYFLGKQCVSVKDGSPLKATIQETHLNVIAKRESSDQCASTSADTDSWTMLNCEMQISSTGPAKRACPKLRFSSGQTS